MHTWSALKNAYSGRCSSRTCLTSDDKIIEVDQEIYLYQQW